MYSILSFIKESSWSKYNIAHLLGNESSVIQVDMDVTKWLFLSNLIKMKCKNLSSVVVVMINWFPLSADIIITKINVIYTLLLLHYNLKTDDTIIQYKRQVRPIGSSVKFTYKYKNLWPVQ